MTTLASDIASAVDELELRPADPRRALSALLIRMAHDPRPSKGAVVEMCRLVDAVFGQGSRSCATCGAVCSGHGNRKYCSRRCADRANYLRAKKRKPARACVECEVQLPAGRHKFCSDDCCYEASKRRQRAPVKQCPDCGGEVDPANGRRRCSSCAETWRRTRPNRPWSQVCPCGVRFTALQRSYCSDECPARVGYGPPSPGLLQLGKTRVPCRTCGVVFRRERRNGRYCSPECSYQKKIDRSMGLYRAAYETGRVKQAMLWRFELVGYLRDRDGDDCRLCGDRLRFGVSTGPRGDDDLGATVDHIVPYSISRDDSLSNLQLTHWSCNRSKGARVPGVGEQLRLVG